MDKTIQFTLNGRATTLAGDAQRTLLNALRHELHLTGTKYGCGSGLCGACTVLVGGRPVRACLTELARVEGQEVLTIEGMGGAGRLHPLQQAFLEHGAFQCGYCTPGMLLAALALLRAHPHPTRQQIVTELDGQLCRCGAHQRIVAAIESVAGHGGGRS